MDAAKQATPHSVLIEQLMDSRVPKTEREHAARMEIEMLREALRLPAQAHRQWVGLTGEDIHNAFNFVEFVKQISFDRETDEWCANFAAHLEENLKEKNT